MSLIKARPSESITWPSRFQIDNGLAHLQLALLNGFRPTSENSAVNYQSIVRQPLPQTAAMPKKRRPGNAKLDLDKDSIQKIKKCGLSNRALARHFKCSERSIRRLLGGK